jgi:hypothetical protein
LLFVSLLERGKTSGRSDDNIDSIKKRYSRHARTEVPRIGWFELWESICRFKTFENETMPVVQAFEKQGLRVRLCRPLGHSGVSMRVFCIGLVRRIDASRNVSDVW